MTVLHPQYAVAVLRSARVAGASIDPVSPIAPRPHGIYRAHYLKFVRPPHHR